MCCVFLSCRFGKSAVTCLKSAILDFYSVEELIDAKIQLLQDAKSLQSVDTKPHVPDRRDGELRSVKIVDDIFIVFTYLLRLTDLPKYVAEGPDSMPSIRLMEICQLL